MISSNCNWPIPKIISKFMINSSKNKISLSNSLFINHLWDLINYILILLSKLTLSRKKDNLFLITVFCWKLKTDSIIPMKMLSWSFQKWNTKNKWHIILIQGINKVIIDFRMSSLIIIYSISNKMLLMSYQIKGIWI